MKYNFFGGSNNNNNNNNNSTNIYKSTQWPQVQAKADVTQP